MCTGFIESNVEIVMDQGPQTGVVTIMGTAEGVEADGFISICQDVGIIRDC
jgi:hypothetical protein